MRASQILSFTAVLMASITASAAETPPAPATPAEAPVSADPQNTTATFGDWVVRCSRGPEAGAKRVCEAVQSLVVKGQTAPIAQIAFGRSDKDHMITVLLPVKLKQISIIQSDSNCFDLLRFSDLANSLKRIASRGMGANR
jgi:invasion protein IalB